MSPERTDATATAPLRERAKQALMRRVARTDDDGRAEALAAFVGMARPDLPPEAAKVIAEKAPRLMPELTAKWIGMFVDRLFETVPQAQIEVLCDGTEENEAALALAYVMFLESERMEKQMAEDLAAADLPTGPDGGDLAAEVMRRLAMVEEKRRQQAWQKAQAYKADRRKVH